MGATIAAGVALPVCAALSGCLIGVPLFAATALALVAHQTSRALANEGLPFAKRPSFAAGTLVVVYGMMLGFVSMIGAGLGELVEYGHPARDWIIWGSVVGCAVVFQLFASPLMLLPHVLIDKGMPSSVSGALAKGLHAGSLVGYGPLATRGVLLVLMITGPPILVDTFGLTGLAVTGIAWVLAPGLCSAGLATHYARVRPALQAAPEDPEEAPRALRGVVGLAAVLTVACLGYVLYAVVAPLPMRRAAVPYYPDQPEHDPPEEQGHERYTLRNGLTLEVAPGGVMVRAADGGGAGLVPTPEGDTPLHFLAHEDYDRITVEVTLDGYRGGMFAVTRDGVRIDDDLGARLDERIGPLAAIFVGIGVLGWLAFLLGLRDLAGMRSLRALRSAEDVSGGGDELRLFEGRLKVRDGKLRVRQGRAIADGSVIVESGELRFRWPTDTWIPLETMDGDLRDGCHLALLGRFTSLARAGHREMFAPWPEDARALACDRSGAVGHLAGRAARRAAIAITPGIIGWLAAGITFVAHGI